MRKKKKDDWVDDGKTIANMNVDGMPWYNPEKKEKKDEEKIVLTPKEKRTFIWATIRSALLIALIFAGVFFLFILFLDKVLFKN